MLKYQISGKMIRAKMEEILNNSKTHDEDWYTSADRKELYEDALEILRLEMAAQKAADQWEQTASRIINKDRTYPYKDGKPMASLHRTYPYEDR